MMCARRISELMPPPERRAVIYTDDEVKGIVRGDQVALWAVAALVLWLAGAAVCRWVLG